MRTPLRFVLIALAVLFAPTFGFAQAPLPGTIASGTLTRAQQDELNRRLGALQGRFNALAGETQLRETAVRNIAVEIFGAQPNLDFETYAALIENGARELRTLLTEARGRTEINPALAALRQQAIEAAEAGRLREARGLYDQLVARSTETFEARWAREDAARAEERRAETLAVAADMAEAARLAYVAADYLDAARRYGEAAARAPAGVRERWQYRLRQSDSLQERGRLFGEPAPLLASVEIYRDQTLPLVSRERAPLDWAKTQNNLGNVLSILADRGDDMALADAIAAYRAALAVFTREGTPREWATASSNMGVALLLKGMRGDPGALSEALAAHRAALEVFTLAAAPTDWAATQDNLGSVLVVLGMRGDDAALRKSVAAYRAALDVRTRAVAPQDWATTQNNLGRALQALGERGDDQGAREAVVAFRAALEIWDQNSAPALWATTQHNLGNALRVLGAEGDDMALTEAIAAHSAALQVFTRAAAPANWASTQNSLGNAIMTLAERRDDHVMIMQGIAAYRASLEVFTRTAAPTQWANTQNNLARAYGILAQDGDRSQLAPALDAARGALAAFEQVHNTYGAEQARRMIAILESMP